jgi:uncharacterized membrane protein
MGRNNADFNGGYIDFDTWHGNAFRIAKTPSGAAKDDEGNVLPDDPTRWSIVTPENGEAWNWESGSKKHIAEAKSQWDQLQSDPEAKYKFDQIRRAVAAHGS